MKLALKALKIIGIILLILVALIAFFVFRMFTAPMCPKNYTKTVETGGASVRTPYFV